MSETPERSRVTLDDMLDEAASSVPTIRPREARRMIRELEDLVVLDVRDAEEYERLRVPESLQISRGSLEFYIEEASPDTARPILVVSRSGARALLAARTLQLLGYSAVWALEGGVSAWTDWGYPTEGAESRGAS